jgi:hypothetical protein
MAGAPLAVVKTFCQGACFMMNTDRRPSHLLRRALQANGAFSALSGLILLAAAQPLAALLGLSHPMTLVGVGISLLLFSAGLWRNSRRETVNQMEALLAVALDVAWVAGSIAVIFAGVLSPTGNWMVAIVADIVLLFAVWQFLGLRKLRRESAD